MDKPRMNTVKLPVGIPTPVRPRQRTTTKWHRGPLLGKGSFGEVHRVTDESGTARAMKPGRTKDIMIEESVLKEVSKCRRRLQHISKLYGYGDMGVGRRAIIMDLFGSDLKQMLLRLKRDRFEEATAIRLGVQAAESIQELHSLGYLHRDLKPSNWVLGVGGLHRKLYVVDFGLARRFRTKNRLIGERTPPSFIGTVRYASINVHRGLEASQRDDSESWFYAMTEWLTGPPSWQAIRNKDEVLAEKLERFPAMVDDLDDVFGSIFDDFCGLEIGDDVTWKSYMRSLLKYAKDSDLVMTGPFEWEEAELMMQQVAESPVASFETTTSPTMSESMVSTQLEEEIAEAAVENPQNEGDA